MTTFSPPNLPQPNGNNPLMKFFRQNAAVATPGAPDETPRWHHTIRSLLAGAYDKPVRKSHRAPAEKPLTNVAFVLDASGSMSYGKDATITGFNTQVNVVREGAAAAGETTFTACQFASEVWLRRVAASLDALAPLTDESYQPDGGTALFDALGETIAALLQTERIHDAKTATLVTVFTDGEENSSSVYDGKTIGAAIKRLEATGRWTFALVGPKGSVHTLADVLNIAAGNVAAYDPGSLSDRAQAFAATANASERYMSLRSVGVAQSSALYDADAPNASLAAKPGDGPKDGAA